LSHADNVAHRQIGAILGDTGYDSFKQFAEVLARKHLPSKGDSEILRRAAYHGVQHLSEICSGDVAAMIWLVQQILIRARFDLSDSSQRLPIKAKVQDAAIKDYSRLFLEHVGGEQEFSDEARAVAKAFGEMAQWKLLNQGSRNEGTTTPFQAGRLEVYEDSVMDDKSASLYRHLLRFGIFLQEPRGFGEGETTSRRLYFRRLFLPTFGLSFSRRDCIRLHMRDFMLLLKQPMKTRKLLIERWEKRLRRSSRQSGSGQMTFVGLEEDNEFD
jgi:hypothetical protein